MNLDRLAEVFLRCQQIQTTLHKYYKLTIVLNRYEGLLACHVVFMMGKFYSNNLIDVMSKTTDLFAVCYFSLKTFCYLRRRFSYISQWFDGPFDLPGALPFSLRLCLLETENLYAGCG